MNKIGYVKLYSPFSGLKTIGHVQSNWFIFKADMKTASFSIPLRYFQKKYFRKQVRKALDKAFKSEYNTGYAYVIGKGLIVIELNKYYIEGK